MTHFVDISLIQIAPNRQRVKFDEGGLVELRESIEGRGLLHPLVLREEGENLILVAGERRLRAIQDIYALGGEFRYNGRPVTQGLVPFTNLRELSPLEALEAEYEENVKRTDLDWDEKAAATKRLAELRAMQAAAAGKPLPTVGDIALEVRGRDDGAYHTETRKELLVAEHLDDPDVAGSKTLDEAFKALKRKETMRRNAELGELVGRTFSAASHRLHTGDFFEWAKTQPGFQFDVILADPPYGMGADEFGDSGGVAAAHGYDDSRDNFLDMMKRLPSELTRLAKPESHLYLFCDIHWFQFLRDQFGQEGWKVFRTPLVWHKPAAYRAPWPAHGPQRKYELILYAIRGDKKSLRLAGDVLTYTTEENLGHAAQKPVGLYADLLSRSAGPGSLILDPMCGSGPVFPAAHVLKATAIGVERDVASVGIAAKRIKELE